MSINSTLYARHHLAHVSSLSAVIVYFMIAVAAGIALCEQLSSEDCGCRDGAADGAIVAGVLLCLVPQSTMMLQQGGMMAADGRCKTLDASGDGYVRAEACQAMVLGPHNPLTTHSATSSSPPAAHPSPLARSTSFPSRLPPKHGASPHHTPQNRSPPTRRHRSGSPPERSRSETNAAPLALIVATAVNTNGRASALTAPHGPSQQSLMVAALQRGRVAPAAVSSLQMHANGTPLGDPIEVAAVSAILGQVTPIPCLDSAA